MKANRKFLKTDDDAVSPVIAVILMVAITVVLAATVYVWVSGFGGGGQAAKTAALASAGGIGDAYDVVAGAKNSTDVVKNYTVSSATPGLKYKDLKLTLDGAPVQCEDDTPGNADAYRVMKGGTYTSSWVECSDTTGLGPDALVSAGDIVQIYDDGGGLSGKTLRLLDSQANSVVLTLVVG